MARSLFLYIAASIDGYIAKPGDDLSFLSLVQQEGEDYGYADFIQSVDTVIIGRKTYDWVMQQVPEFPHADKQTFVITRSARAAQGSVQFYTGAIKTLVDALKATAGGHIFCDGGALVVNELLRARLIDEMIISVIPVLLGDGVRLFQGGYPEQTWELLSSKHFPTGLVQLHYRLRAAGV